NKHANGKARASEDESADWFERFWRIYPDRGEHNNPKKPAREKFLAAVKRGVDPELITEAAGNYAAHIARTNRDQRYDKQAQHWLHAECWEQYQAKLAPAQPKFGGMI